MSFYSISLIGNCEQYYSFYLQPHIHVQAGNVPLGTAAENGHLHVVERLLEARASVNHQNKVMIMYLQWPSNTILISL